MKKKGSNKRKALGRGLSALLPEPGAEPASAPAGDGLQLVPVDEVHAGVQPRKSFPEKDLLELAESIKRQGVLQPLLVRRDEEGFVIVAGERRWRAAKLAGAETVPVVIKEATESEAFELALVENVQRQDLNPIEEAEAYDRLIEEYGYTQERVAKRVGRDRSTVANELRLLKLPSSVQELVAGGKLTSGHARALLGLGEKIRIEAIARKVVRKGLSVRQTEKLVRKAGEPGKPTGSKQSTERSPAIRDLEERLQRSMKTRVRLKAKGKGSGKIEITYGSLDELDRLLDILL
jgi:ParB family chromosome partitioning protein